MSRILLLTSNKIIFDDLVRCLKLKQKEIDLFNGKDLDLLLLKDSKIDATLSLTHLLSLTEYSSLILLNPIQCPDINIPLGKIIVADSVTEWDKPVRETTILPLYCPDVLSDAIKGLCMSGDRLCLNKTTPILHSKIIDFITFPVAKVSYYFNKPFLSIGIVADHCSANYDKLIQSSIKELSSKIVSFYTEISSRI